MVSNLSVSNSRLHNLLRNKAPRTRTNLLTQVPVLLRILDRGQKGTDYGVAVDAASTLSRVGGKRV
jgi:hypothetical protein